jgi:hypothetical protein
MKFAKLLEMRSFFPPHIILGVDEQQDLKNQIYQIVGNEVGSCVSRWKKYKMELCFFPLQVDTTR